MSRRKPPEPPGLAALVYFLDRCMGAHVLPTALRAAGMSLKTMQEEGFAQDVEDCEWIPDIAARGWIIITKDKNIRRDTLELRAVMASRARYFTLGKADRSATEMVEIILKHRSTIERLVQHRAPPVVAQINMSEVLLRGPDGQLHAVKGRPSRKG